MIPLFYNKSQVIEALKGINLIKSIEIGFVEYSRGNSVVPPVGELLFDEPPGDVHIKYGYIKSQDNYVVKIASGFSNNEQLGLSSSHGVMVMFDKNTGYLKCILHDEGYLTNVRTAIAGAICAKYLAPKHVKGIGIVGNGIQARMQLEYLSDIVNCKEVYILGRDKSRVERYIDDMNKFDFNINMVNNSKELCENSNLIVTTTNANESLIFKDDVMKGTHITAVGSDTPDKRELDPEILKMANSLIVDSIPQCLERGETKKALDKDLINEDKLIELGEIIDYGKKYRKDEDEITVADLTGVAVQDIMITNAVYKQLKMEK
jgi:ornithine cyclodeaminase